MALDTLLPLLLGLGALILAAPPSLTTRLWFWKTRLTSPGLSTALRRLRHHHRATPHAAWDGLLAERDALFARNIAPLQAGGPQAMAMAISVLAWNALVMPSLHTDIAIAPDDEDNQQRALIISCLIAATVDPTSVAHTGCGAEQGQMMLQDAEMIRDSLFQHDRAFGRTPSVSWMVFSTLAIAQALPGAGVRTHARHDPTATAWAQALITRTRPPFAKDAR